MKKLKCDLCEHVAEGETFAEWMEAMKPHYKEAHADFMQTQMQKPHEEQMKEMQQWMSDYEARFEAAEES